jgi:4'-phosphopantetheinyl transferase
MIALWLVDINSLGTVSSPLLETLSAEEKEKAKLLRPSDQRRFLLSRIALRNALSESLGGDPRSWQFHTEDTGKMTLVNLARADFSVSHSENGLGIAVSTSGPVGFDLEVREKRKSFEFDELFPVDQFSQNEIGYLRRQPLESQWDEMLKIWTRKEAYSKLLGMGLHLDFSLLDMIAWPAIEPDVEIETHEVLINQTEYFMSLASRVSQLSPQKVVDRLDIRGSNLFSCVNP